MTLTASECRERYAEFHARTLIELYPTRRARRDCLAGIEADDGIGYRRDIGRRMQRLWRDGVRPLIDVRQSVDDAEDTP